MNSKTFYKKTNVNTRNMKITIIRLVSTFLCFHVVSLRLLLNSWHSDYSERKVQLFLLESKPR